MKQFFQAYSAPDFWQQAVAKLSVTSVRKQAVAKFEAGVMNPILEEIPWGHHILLLNKAEPPAARLYYLRATAQFGWSRNVLLNQIQARAYERSLVQGKTHNFPTVLPEYLAEQAEEALKSSYNLEFLGIAR